MRVSVVVPAYNRAHVIGRALRSIVEQKGAELEILVVDDGSTDGTVDVARDVDPRIQVLRHASRQGAQAARNTGIRAATGGLIAFLDSDDHWLPGSLAARAERLRGDVDAVHSGGEIRGDAGGQARTFDIPPLEGDVLTSVLRRPGPMLQSLLVRAEVLRGIGPLDESLVAYQEWDTYIRLAQRARFAFVSEPTFVWDTGGTDTISRQAGRNARGYEQVTRKHAWLIASRCGPWQLARHFSNAAELYRQAGRYPDMLRCTVAASACWPTLPRAVVKAALAGPRPDWRRR